MHVSYKRAHWQVHVHTKVEDKGFWETTTRTPIFPAAIDTECARRLTEEQAATLAAETYAAHKDHLKRAIAQEDLDGAHNAWCDYAVDYLVKASGKPHPNGAPARAQEKQAPSFRRHPRCGPKRRPAIWRGHL